MDLKCSIAKAPQAPGVYFFKNARRRVLYVGKAVNLRARLQSYGQTGWKEDMLREATSVAWEELSSDIEALIQEAALIKKLKPYYNILMRDDKNYFFVAITKDEFPRIFLTHQPRLSDKWKVESAQNLTTHYLPLITYIGPFTDGDALKRTLRLLRRAFPYCTCPRTPRHKRKCVNAEIGKCLGFCCADISASKKEAARYRANIAAIKKILTGKTRALERELLKKMHSAAKRRRYEEAQMYRDQTASLARIFEHSPYLKKDIGTERAKGLTLLKNLLGLAHAPNRIECYDISHHQGDTSVASMVVFENGQPAKNEYRKFIIRSVRGVDDFASMREVLARRLTHREWQSPNLILVDGGKGQLSAARAVVGKRVALAAIAKREEELYVAGKKEPYKLKKLPPPLLHLVTAIRNEAHRFAISFHRKRRSRTLT